MHLICLTWKATSKIKDPKNDSLDNNLANRLSPLSVVVYVKLLDVWFKTVPPRSNMNLGQIWSSGVPVIVLFSFHAV